MATSSSRQPLVTSVAIKRPLSVGFKLVLLFLTLLTIAAGIMAWHSEQEHKRARSSLRAVDASLARVSGELESMGLRESLRDAQLKQQQDIIQTLLLDGPALRQRWLTDRIDAAVTVAERALQLRHDAVAARRALLSVDALLNEQRFESLDALHRALKQDIKTLAALEPIDTGALYLRLSAVQQDIAALKVSTVRAPTPKPAPTSPQENSAMADLWQQGVAKFRQLIVVRHHDEPLAPVLDDARLDVLRSQIDSQVLQAQVALLQGDATVYREALAAAMRRVQARLAALPVAQTEALLAELEDLQAQIITRDEPALISRAALTALPSLGGER